MENGSSRLVSPVGYRWALPVHASQLLPDSFYSFPVPKMYRVIQKLSQPPSFCHKCVRYWPGFFSSFTGFVTSNFATVWFSLKIPVKKPSIDLRGNPSHGYGASLAIWDHTVLPATWHKRTCPTITPANQASTRFTYPVGMEGWVDLGRLIAPRPGIEPTTAWLQVRPPNRYATKPPTLHVKCVKILLSFFKYWYFTRCCSKVFDVWYHL